MTSRTYDYSVKLQTLSGFTLGKIVAGSISNTTGAITSIDSENSTLKIKTANAFQSFVVGERLIAKDANMSGSANGYLDTTSLPFQANTLTSYTVVGNSEITAITASTFNAQKNSFTQNPIVRLYTLYYPGEWYPPLPSGNPGNSGEGLSWPVDFPIRFAEIVGDTADDLLYNVAMGSTSYIPFPVQTSGLEQSSDGKINDITLTVFNSDNIISDLIENPYLAGNNISNSVMATVNGELVHGIDPRTVNSAPGQLGSPSSLAYQLLATARSTNLNYDPAIVAYYGKANASFDKKQTEAIGGIWKNIKTDSRDLLGGVVEVKTTFANFLNFWPEYSIVTAVGTSNVVVKNSSVYRVGDKVTSNKTTQTANVLNIIDNTLQLSSNIPTVVINSPIYIYNDEADSANYLEDVLKIDQLEGLNEYVAKFGLVSWLQYFKASTPRRKYYKNVCQWKYKGAECQYPGPGGLPIPGTTLLSNTMPIGINNEVTTTFSTSLISTNSWVIGAPLPPSDYSLIGSNTKISRISTPFGELKAGLTTAGTGIKGIGTGVIPISNQTYRFTSWVKLVNNTGFLTLSAAGYNSSSGISGLSISNSISVSSNVAVIQTPISAYKANSWVLVTSYLNPRASNLTANVNSGITQINTVSAAFSDAKLLANTAFVSYSITANATGTIEVYEPRIDLVSATMPDKLSLLTITPYNINKRDGADICGKSLKSCEVRNNVHRFGGFPGVGRTVPTF